MPAKCRVCNVRLLPSGVCIDHGAQPEATPVEQPPASAEPADSDVAMTKQKAFKYRKELGTMRSNRGTGPPLDASQSVARVVALRRRTATIPLADRRAADAKMLEELEKTLPRHVVDEADRAIGALTTEIRKVSDAVAAVHGEVRDVRHDLRAMARGDLPLDPGASRADERAAISLAQAALAARKRALAQADREERQRVADDKKRARGEASSSNVRSRSAGVPRAAPVKREPSQSRHAPTEKRARGSRPSAESARPPALVEETHESLRLFMCSLECKGNDETWMSKFDRDVKKETGMTVRARLNREDYRRRFISGVLMSMDRGGGRDAVDIALGEIECRRRALLDLMSYEEQVAYNRELEEKDAARLAAASSRPSPMAPVPAALDEAREKPSGSDKPTSIEETDESFQAFKDSMSTKDPSTTWTEKFANDAQAEAGMSVQTRMDRDGVRYTYAELLLSDSALTEAEEVDLETAKQGAFTRRHRMMSDMTKAEQRAYKPLRK